MASSDTPLPLSAPQQEEPTGAVPDPILAEKPISGVAEEKPISGVAEEKPSTITSDAALADTRASTKELAISTEEPTAKKHVVEVPVEENPTIETSTTAEAAENPSIETTTTAAVVEENPAIETSAAAEAEPVPEEIQERTLPEDTIEESYYLRDLKESQKKALLQLKAKIQAAIMDNTFLDAPKPVKTKEKDVKEEEKKEEAEEEGEKTEEKEEEDGQATIEPLTEEEGEKTELKEEDNGQAANGPPADTSAEVSSIDAVWVPDATREVTLELTPPEDYQHVGAPPVSEGPALEDLALWGIPLLHSKGDERTDVLLLKFLRARDFKVGKALSMLQDTIAWRKEFDADGLIEEETPAGFQSSFIHGVDREGHPVCYNGELSSKKSVENEAELKSRIQVLEKGIQALDFSPNGVHSMVQVVDFSGHSPAFLGRGLRLKILDLLQNNYPELVSKQIFINVPWYFPPLLSFTNKRTRSKAVLAKPGRVAETLFKYISPDQVPVQYGGLSRLNDTEFAGIEAPVTQLVVKAGEKQSIELPIPNAGRLVWDISVIGWEVVYDEEFVPDEGYIKVIHKASRIAANEVPLRNAFVTDEPGKMVLTIDNTPSRRRRVVVYRSTVVAS